MKSSSSKNRVGCCIIIIGFVILSVVLLLHLHMYIYTHTHVDLNICKRHDI